MVYWVMHRADESDCTHFIYINKYVVVYLTSLCVNWAFFGMSGPF
jgi:hypothetical protein